MRHLLLSIIIISLVGILMVPNAFAVKEITVQNAPGSSVPGCEKTDRCFIPSTAKINPGDTVVWTNPDRAVHTVTSGNPTTGPDGYFDSGLMLAGGSYSKTFTSFGTYDYFCMVHPWMEGTVIVSGGTSSPSSTSKTSSKLILDPLPTTFNAKGSNSKAEITFSGRLVSVDNKKWLMDAPITLKFTGFTFDGKYVYETTTDSDGKFNEKFTISPGNNYRVQAVFEGAESKTSEWTPSKSQTEYFIVTSTTSPSQPSTSSLGAPTFLKLDPLPKTFNTDKSPYSRAIVTFSGQLMTADKKFYITDEQIKLLFTPSIESWNNNSKRSTDDEGKFNIRIAISQGQNYRIQAIFDGDNQLGPSKSLIQSFSVTPSPSPSQPSTSTSSGGFEWAWILVIVGVVAAGAAGVLVKKGLKKTPKATPQRKTFGVKQPKKRRTAGSPVGASSSADGPSTYEYFECPNCHEPSAPQGKLRQNPDGSQFCSVCGWKS